MSDLDAVLVQRVVRPGDVLLDLGCGGGRLVVEAARRGDCRGLIGLDSSFRRLPIAGARLGDLRARAVCVNADACLLPIASQSIDAVVCHNVLELVEDPSALFAEARRVLREGGRALWSHGDFDGMIINGADQERTRRVVHAFADLKRPWSRDGWMGRRLPGLLAGSVLTVEEVYTDVELWRSLQPVRWWFDGIVDSLRGSESAVAGEVDSWLDQLESADAGGVFLFAQPVFSVLTR